MEFIIVNGEIVRKEEANLTSFFWNEPFLISQKIWFGFGGIPLFTENIESVIQQIQLFDAPIPKLLKTKRELFRITKRMLNKNKFYRSGIIHFRFHINQNSVDFIVTSTAFDEFEFPISQQGILTHFSNQKKDSRNPLLQFDFANQALWKTEEAENRQNQFGNSIFRNENDIISDAISANIFTIKNKILFTPAIQTGCFVDIIRKFILEISTQLNYKVLESVEITQNNILQMDEIFLASEAKGIEWILGIDSKRFLHQGSIAIQQKLNELLKGKVH